MVRYFTMSGLDSSPQCPAFDSSIFACESVRLRTLHSFWVWPYGGAGGRAAAAAVGWVRRGR
jgi:hypothetical protein